MSKIESAAEFRELVLTAAEFEKCRKCRCMGKSLETVKRELLTIPGEEARILLPDVQRFLDRMETSQYN